MRVTAPNGREYKLALHASVARNDYTDDRTRSAGHRAARAMLATLYPHDRVFEEVFLPGARWPLYLDLFVPTLLTPLAVEVQGAQHRRFSPFLHGTEEKFREQRKRDAGKRQYCERNGWRFVTLDDDKPETWRALLLGAGEGEPRPLGGAEGAPPAEAAEGDGEGPGAARLG
jgi:hypothetical protein